MELVTSMDMELYEYAKQLAEERLRSELSGLQALHQYRKQHPARRRLQPTHSAPQDPSSRVQQVLHAMTAKFVPPQYTEGPLC
mmetsp:Transcript_4492/g.7643  ORF Transcript_4492/g.7643 Transcript_4492/m.7643 type:complete len:83 (-) Transcript_4492:773-1021(-)